MSRGLDSLQPWLSPWAIWLARQASGRIQVTSALRSHQDQLELFTAYLRGESRYPALPPGRSLHQFGRAFDLYTPDTKELRRLAQIWVGVGGRWGGESDPIHFEA